MARKRKNIVLAALDASFILGAVCTAAFYAVGGVFFLITCRWLRRDMVAK